ncbi:type II secretion system F family protein [Qipengyuania sp. 1XM1-15A]|uniref:type II secretion system F family protein n=1 Tax=Qipengyuania xiamenensis TaxID=2867237 RepID=UPI001C880459|nr:type II secretion system F family protein [Qipengyuania xiamenensis]MBX7533725.1 type II secretion system F family protein [Qipengyuania xiamenensis]
MTAIAIRVMFLIAVFVAVFIVAQMLARSTAQRRSHASAVNRRLSMIESGADRDHLIEQLLKNSPKKQNHLPPVIRGLVESFQRAVFASAVPYSTSTLGMIMLIAGLLVFTLVMLGAAGLGASLGFGTIWLALLIAVAIAFVLPFMILQRIAASRRKKVEKQFPVALDIFVRALRSGHPVASAIELLTKEMEDPIGTEFGIVADEITYGADLVSALHAMAERWDLEDMRMFVVSLAVQSETGGNLAEILENLAEVIRARASMFMKVRALSSEGRMTGWMLSVLPVFTFVTTFLAAPQFYLNVAGDPIFIFVSITLLTLYVIGLLIIRKLVDIKV